MTLTWTGDCPPADPDTPGTVDDEDMLRLKGIIVESDREGR